MKKLPQHTKYYFDQFAHIGGAWNWHPLDVERFRAFIHAAHKGRVKLSRPQLEELLLEKNFESDTAATLADWYQFGRDLLRERPAFNYIGLNRIKL
jgi:hypothetical protein